MKTPMVFTLLLFVALVYVTQTGRGTQIIILASLFFGLAVAAWPPMLGYRRGVHSLRRALGLAALNITGLALGWAAALWLGGWLGRAAFAWAQSAGWGIQPAQWASLLAALLAGFVSAWLVQRSWRGLSPRLGAG